MPVTGPVMDDVRMTPPAPLLRKYGGQDLAERNCPWR